MLLLAPDSMQWGIEVQHGLSCSSGVSPTVALLQVVLRKSKDCKCALFNSSGQELLPAQVARHARKSCLLPGKFYIFRQSFEDRGA